MTSLDQLLADPHALHTVQSTDIPMLAASIAERQMRLAALSSGLIALQSAPAVHESDEMLELAPAAKLLGMSESWLQKRGKKLPFQKKIGGRVKFSRRGIDRWLQTRKA